MSHGLNRIAGEIEVCLECGEALEHDPETKKFRCLKCGWVINEI